MENTSTSTRLKFITQIFSEGFSGLLPVFSLCCFAVTSILTTKTFLIKVDWNVQKYILKQYQRSPLAAILCFGPQVIALGHCVSPGLEDRCQYESVKKLCRGCKNYYLLLLPNLVCTLD